MTLGVVLCAIGGLLLVRRWFISADQTQHDVADPLSQVVGMMFAILLGFMVGDAMQRFANARSIVQQESASLADVLRLSIGLPDATRDKIRKLCLDYADEVVHHEWALMAKKSVSKKAWDDYVEITYTCAKYNPVTQGQSNVQQCIIPAVVSLGDNRRMRVESLNSSLPAVLWYVLFIGAVATIIFTYFFAAHHLRTQIVMVSIVSLVLCLNIFLLASYDDPFSGDICIHPTTFERDYERFSAELAMPAK
jgi:hypothetical protein